MNDFPEDLLAIIIAKLPIKIFTTCKLVCKQWKSIVESPYFRDLFLFLHQNSPSSSWSLMFSRCNEVVAHYGCDTWGLERSPGSYITSFLTNKFKTHRDEYKVWDYTDVGLILVSEELSISTKNRSLYVANPVTQECIEIPSHAHLIKEYARPFGIATRTENGLLLDYKVVLTDGLRINRSLSLSLLIYSSETGLWTLNTVHLPFSLCWQYFSYSISLKGSIYWIGCNNDNEDVVVSMDFYATGIGSNQCHVNTFPDSGKYVRFMRYFRISQGFIIYMNIVSIITQDDGSVDDKLCVWRLKNWEWQLISDISLPAFMNPEFDYFPLTINPFDAKTVYFCSSKQQSLLSINLRNGKIVIHSELDRSNDSRTLISLGEYKNKEYIQTFVLPQWLHRIPKTMSII